jgi:hypothetical protein
MLRSAAYACCVCVLRMRAACACCVCMLHVRAAVRAACCVRAAHELDVRCEDVIMECKNKVHVLSK